MRELCFKKKKKHTLTSFIPEGVDRDVSNRCIRKFTVNISVNILENEAKGGTAS